ncbi:MAG TPA: serine protease [Drouetiella sp.]|jgi:S1-C subfamily serine protease
MPDTIIHELKPGLEPQSPEKAQPEIDAVTRKLYEDIAPSMVKIKVDDGSGSGFAIDRDGDIATDAHVVLGNRHFTVITNDGKEHKATLKALDDVNDLAIVHIEGELPKDLKPLHLGSSKDLKPDQNVWAFGHPAGWDPLYVAPGYFRKAEKGQDVLDAENDQVQTHAKKVLAGLTPKEKEEADAELKKPMLNARVNIQHGSSGGPLVDKDGNVVAITDLSNLQSNSDFTPVESLIALMNQKTPKFNFTHKTIDGVPTLTDISRTASGDYRAPFVDNIIVMGNGKKDTPSSLIIPEMPKDGTLKFNM